MRNPFLHARFFFAGKLIHGLLQQVELCIWEGTSYTDFVACVKLWHNIACPFFTCQCPPMYHNAVND